MNIEFNKDLSHALIDILNLGWNGVKYPENVSEDDTREAFEMADFVPDYATDFKFGPKVGLVPEDTIFNPILPFIRFFTGDSNW